ncbi:MAG TPA: hypothetical protein VN843_18090 [Anaerolineales bacterium]|nr:hypothetical protein [Anaerolineales bacterium]
MDEKMIAGVSVQSANLFRMKVKWFAARMSACQTYKGKAGLASFVKTINKYTSFENIWIEKEK